MELLKRDIENQLEQLLKGEELTEAQELNETIAAKMGRVKKVFENYKLSTTALPMYFSGKINSEIVFVELNPAKGLLLEPKIHNNSLNMAYFKLESNPKIKSFDDYITFFENFGKFKAQSKGLTSFEKRQLDFFAGFDEFGLSKKIEYSERDMINIRMDKLQLEIVPYSSKEFNFSYFPTDYIKKRVDQIIKIINQYDRKYIFISGRQSAIKKAFKEVEFQKYTIDNKTVYIGKKIIENNIYCFIPSYKNRYTLKNQTIRQKYGELCKSLIKPPK